MHDEGLRQGLQEAAIPLDTAPELAITLSGPVLMVAPSGREDPKRIWSHALRLILSPALGADPHIFLGHLGRCTKIAFRTEAAQITSRAGYRAQVKSGPLITNVRFLVQQEPVRMPGAYRHLVTAASEYPEEFGALAAYLLEADPLEERDALSGEDMAALLASDSPRVREAAFRALEDIR